MMDCLLPTAYYLPGGQVEIIDLTRMNQGQEGKVVKIEGGGGLQRKLDALGIRLCTRIKKIFGH